MKTFKTITLLSMIAAAAPVRATMTSYSCSEFDGDFPSFKLDLQTGILRSPAAPLAFMNSEDGAIQNVGHYTSHIIGGQTRLTGLTSYSIDTSGGFGNFHLSLVGDPELSGNGTVEDDGVQRTILIECKPIDKSDSALESSEAAVEKARDTDECSSVPDCHWQMQPVRIPKCVCVTDLEHVLYRRLSLRHPLHVM